MQASDLYRQWLIRDKYKGNANAEKLRGDLERIKRGEPVDYVIGSKDFLGAKIDLSHSPLIPRPETEYWVERAIAEIKRKSKSRKIAILDLFSGSGAVGVAILTHLPNAHVDFGEIDAKLLKQIKLNLNLNGISKRRYRITKTNVFGAIREKYDYIFANPPYIPTGRKRRLSRSVVRFEPHKALFGGRDGMKFLEQFLKEAGEHLSPRGVIYFEFDSPQKKRLEKLLKESGYQFHLREDQFDRYRWGGAGL